MLWQEKCADGIRTFFFALLHAKRGVFVHALRVQVGGGAPTPREMPRSGKDIVATATRISAAGGRKAAKRRTDSRFAKPRIFIARAACCPDMGLLSMQWKVPERERFYVLFASTKRTKSSRRAAALSTPGDGSKLYRLYFFVTFPALVPKPAYGATRFFGCFEPVRKGYCSADARPLLSETGMSYFKLTGACHI